MKILSAFGRLLQARNGKIDEPVEALKPMNWLIRRVRVERISGHGRVRSERGDSLRP
jgi:hypothetical protein